MQVSWIEPEEVASLAESLRPSPRPAAVNPPTPAENTQAVQPLVQEQVSVAEDAPKSDDAPEMPNLAAFRQRLQSIRERAIRAGLMTPQPPVTEVMEAEAPPTGPVQVKQPTPPIPVTEVAPVEVIPEAPPPEPAVVHTPNPQPPSSPPIQISPGASVKDRLEAFAHWSSQQWGAGELLIVDEYGDLLFGPPKKSGLVLSTMMAWNAAIRASAQAASGATQIQQQTLTTGQTLTVIPCQTRLGLLQIALVKSQAPWETETTALREALIQVMDITD